MAFPKVFNTERILKWLIFLSTIAFIVARIKHDTVQIENIAQHPDYAYIIFCVVLAPINWLLESVKWKKLTSKIETLSLLESLKSVTAGVATSILTPNRIGEFGGRILAFSPENRVQATINSFVGSFSQLIVTYIFGILSLYFYINLLSKQLFENKTVLFLVLGVVIIICLFVYFNSYKILMMNKKITWLDKLLKGRLEPKALQDVNLFPIFALSVLRYIVFSFQFVLILKAFGTTGSYASLFSIVAFTFFAANFLPSLAFSEPGIKSSILILIIGTAAPSSVAIVFSTLSLWIINIVTPALFGIRCISKYNLLTKKQ
jgi:uncharacterized membrane protein YbhN (UPF0104 family)